MAQQADRYRDEKGNPDQRQRRKEILQTCTEFINDRFNILAHRQIAFKLRFHRDNAGYPLCNRFGTVS